MNNDLFLVLKSTIDKLGYQMAATLSGVITVNAIDMDDLDTADEKLASDAPGVVWQTMTMNESPKDPLYEVMFMVGAKTSKDPGSYKLAEFMSELNQMFYRDAVIDVYDYSGAVAGTREAILNIVDVSLAPQQFDATSGVRLMAVSAKLQRLI